MLAAGEATPAQIGAFLTLLHAKGETAEEVTGLARAMLDAAVPCPLDPAATAPWSTWSGTGGDRLASINVTTLAAFITAGCGVPVCKHGNRAASSSVGTADVLEALGVAIELGPEGVARCVAEAGMGFCFAQRFHPAMRFVGPVRRELGVPTVFNFLGPLANPARATLPAGRRERPAWGPSWPASSGPPAAGTRLIVHADDGLDELSVTSPSSVLEVRGRRRGGVRVAPGGSTRPRWGSPRRPWRTSAAGTPPSTPAAIRSVLEGETGARRDIGVLNAAAALVVAGRGRATSRTGLALAAESVDSGRAAERARRAGGYVPSKRCAGRRTDPPGATRRVRRRGRGPASRPWHSAMTQPPNPPPVMRAPRTPGCASRCSTSSSTVGHRTR